MSFPHSVPPAQAAELPPVHISVPGAVDFHVHAGPDVRERKLDVGALVNRARAAGMGGLVFKNHHTSTAIPAAVLTSTLDRFTVHGGVVLNRAVGGINPAAVDAALRMGGRVVWMPTLDAAHERSYRGMPGGLSILDETGGLIPAVQEVIELVREHFAVLALGHLSPPEMVALVPAARRAGVRKIVVNHPEIRFLDLSGELQSKLSGPGVFFERCYPRSSHFVGSWDEMAAAIRQTGVAQTVLGTDLGQPDAPDPVAGFAEMLIELEARGFTPDEVARMARDNASFVLSTSS